MKLLYKIIRTIVVSFLVLLFATPVLLYVVLPLPVVQDYAARAAREELTQLLGTPVDVGKVRFSPFNRIVVEEVSVTDPHGREALTIGHLGAGISLIESLTNRRWAISYAEILDLDLKLYKPVPGSPLNIDPILERFKSKPSGPSARFDLSVNTVVIRRSAISYEILSAPDAAPGVFSAKHVRLTDLCADLTCRRASNELIDVSLRRLSATDRSGLSLTNLSMGVVIDTVALRVNDLKLSLPSSEIKFGQLSFPSPLVGGFSAKSISTECQILEGSHLSTVDIAPLLPFLAGMETAVDLSLSSRVNGANVEISSFRLSTSGHEIELNASGEAERLDSDERRVSLSNLELTAFIPSSLTLLASSQQNSISALAEKLKPLSSLGAVTVKAELSAEKSRGSFDGTILTECGNINFEGSAERLTDNGFKTAGSFETIDLNPSALSPHLADLTTITADGKFDLRLKPGAIAVEGKRGRETAIYGDAAIAIREAKWDDIVYHEIGIDAEFDSQHIRGTVNSDTPKLAFTIDGAIDLYAENSPKVINAQLRDVYLGPFVKGPYSELSISGLIDASFSGSNPENIDGNLSIRDLLLQMPERSIKLDALDAEALKGEDNRQLSINSSLFDLKLSGEYTYKGIVSTILNSISATLPALVSASSAEDVTSRAVDASLHARFYSEKALSSFFKLPVELIDTVSIDGSFTTDGTAISVGAPYLAKKNKIIERTRLNFTVAHGNSVVSASTTMPSKKGPLSLRLVADARYNTLGTQLDWNIGNPDARYGGSIDVGARFFRDSVSRKLTSTVNINPSDLVINDSVWNIAPSRLDISDGEINVKGFNISRPNEHLAINGTASADTTKILNVDLKNINLDYIFSTLDISPNVNFGGIASGEVEATGLLSPQPQLTIPQLYVSDFSYSGCVMGDATIRSWWDNAAKAINLSADVRKSDGGRTIVDGFINPLTEALDLKFNATKAPVGFLQNFMAAFASEVTGSASGRLHLYGTFSNIDLDGDVTADDFGLRLSFTNVAYHVSDSVHIRPGVIRLDNLTIRDRYDNTALLSGELTHRFFHDPVFDFTVSNADRLLLYDISRRQSPDPWYGRVFGSGRASVKGWPGMVEIGVNVTTTQNSRFTLVLDDKEEASDYAFVTLRDRDAARKDSLRTLNDTIPLTVQELQKKLSDRFAEQPTDYAMNFDINITPDATLTLIMDPVARDSITANGSGEMKMTYNSTGDLTLRGDYSIDRGTYIFTMQDVIEKKFNIRQGSSVKFNGNPYAAKLDIVAAYPVKANLSDLDESFLHDGELQNTNLNFNALLKVNGDMRAPDIKFDLEFPSAVTSDIDRKVRSIISTDEMMERQMIYLLALNRFYTPDYMNGTKGNELVSVASSTISSRLSSMLGQLSDNWSIAPAFRSSKGDFSDVEVDLGLSSHLLNNRLLFNGNLGYRDKALNNNSFIGDFDIRYLLNRTGSIQLKAYNRYNDQNYYLKSALTTQGIGVMFKRDFDDWRTFFRRKKKAKSVPTESNPSTDQNKK